MRIHPGCSRNSGSSVDVIIEVLEVLMFGSRTYSDLHIAYDLLFYLTLDFKKL